MKITAGTLFLAVAVFLDSIELISSVEPEQMTLAQLFPGYRQNGYLPPVHIFANVQTTRTIAFTQIGNHSLRRPNREPHFLARGHVIFAWMGDGVDTPYAEIFRRYDYLEPLWKLFPRLEHEEFWVFDTTRNRWVVLIKNEFDKLGVGFSWVLIYAQQHIARIHTLTSDNPDADAHAHHIAYLRANEAVAMLQPVAAEELYSGQSYVVDSKRLIWTRYEKAYDAVFREIVREPRYHI